MSTEEAVQPLNIIKNSATSPPGSMSRPLTEIGSTERRRNSPSFTTTINVGTMDDNRDSSPFNSSPLNQRSPRTFWADRDALSPTRFTSENSPERSISPSLQKRRSSIENLKRASRVKNSTMYARETKQVYDPSSSPIVERPLNNRPWGGHLQTNPFTRNDSLHKENTPMTSPERPTHRRSESKTDVPLMSPSRIPAPSPAPTVSPRREIPSPIKSSLAANGRFASPSAFDAESACWSDDEDDGVRASTPRAQPRHYKSVTFETAPPEVNEYEQQTPEPSSVASGSREGSYESDDYDDGSVDDANSEQDDSFDASLEDTDKTPVVLPDDWRHMSPDSVRKDLADDEYDDVFDEPEGGAGSPAPDATPLRSTFPRPGLLRTDSTTSDGESRPLPPIPGFTSPLRGRNESPRGLAAAAERASSAHRSLPTPPRASLVSKDEILRMREANMTLEDRMGLLALQESLAEVHRNQTADLGLGLTTPDGTSEKNPVEEHQAAQGAEEVDEDDDVAHLADFDVVPSISRESILRGVQSRRFDDLTDHDFAEGDSTFSSPERDYAELANMHPDEPIPSRETSTRFDPEDAAAAASGLKMEDESFIDMDAIPAMQALDDERESSVLRHTPQGDEYDDESRYSSPMSVLINERDDDTPKAVPDHDPMDDAVTAVAETEEHFAPPTQGSAEDHQNRLPSLQAYLDPDEYQFGLKEYITPSPPASSHGVPAVQESKSAIEPPELFNPKRESANEDSFSTPNEEPADLSLAQESLAESSFYDDLDREEEPIPEIQTIPERRATIKTQGKLTARPSGTPADFESMAFQRRQVSGEIPVPPIPDMYRTQSNDTQEESSSDDMDGEQEASDDDSDCKSNSTHADSLLEQQGQRRQSRKQLRLDFDLPTDSLGSGTGLGLGLMEEFDRVIESQKVQYHPPPPVSPENIPSTGASADGNMHISAFTPRQKDGTNIPVRAQKGYLMRQNTKVVVASNRKFSDESALLSPPMSPKTDERPSSRGSRTGPPSSRKSSAEKFLTTEPWNGKARRRSTRKSSGRKSNIGVTPPMPGQESALGTVSEYATTDEVDENAERGRLFVKVVGVKNLDLPMPRNDRLYFQLTLDNGLHCVTTANLELNKSAPIGQEFELVVLSDLEFQLTLTTKLPPAQPRAAHAPDARPTTPSSPTKNKNVFSRLLSSPKKRAERERKEREEAAEAERRRAEEAERKRISMRPTQWDLLRELVDAKTGSFARSYVSLKSHEQHCYGRPCLVDVPCFNEWALEKDASVVTSVRSKRNNGNLAFGRADGLVRRPPYTIGNLELQLLFVPKPKNATDTDMPKSMNAAIREMKAAEQVKESSWEGALSQQGGDCPYWRRRFFRLQGTKLTAYHEHTMQPRATINLSKATKLIDDRSALVADPTSGSPSKTRRKSAFAEEDDGYQFVEEGFRIRFANGETIDFYADNAAQKNNWMDALSQSIGKPATAAAARWTDVVLQKERLDAKNSPQETRKASGESSEGRPSSAPTADVTGKRPMSAGNPTTVPLKNGEVTPPMSPRTGHRQRNQVKSMIF